MGVTFSPILLYEWVDLWLVLHLPNSIMLMENASTSKPVPRRAAGRSSATRRRSNQADAA
jgi:hypothetical protein